MRADDLVPLLAQNPPPGVGMRQGVIVTWNPNTAENTVLVGGQVLTNLPVLVSTEVQLLTEGDVVMILTGGNTWAILGRVAYPGTPEAVSAIQSVTGRIKTAAEYGDGTRNSTAWGDLTGAGVGPSVTTTVGTSGRALVLWTAEMGQTGTWQVKNNPHVGVEVTQGASVIYSAIDGHALNMHLEFPDTGGPDDASANWWLQASMMHVYNSIPPGETTFTMKYRHDSIAPAGDVTFRTREIAVFVL